MTARLNQVRLPMLLFALGCASFYPFWAIFQMGSINDEGYVSVGAVRLLAGEAIYKDFFSHFAPGTYYITYLAYALLGPTVATTRLLAALVTGGLALSVYLIAKRVLLKNWAIVPYTLFLCCGVTQWPILSYHWLGVLGFLLGVLALLRWREQPDRFARGFSCGVSCAFTVWIILPEALALLLLTLIVAIIYRRLLGSKALAAWAAGFIILSALLWAPVLIRASIADVWQQNVLWAVGNNVSNSVVSYEPSAIFKQWAAFGQQLGTVPFNAAVGNWALQSVSYLLCWSCNYLLFYPVFLVAAFLIYKERPGSSHTIVVVAMLTHMLSWSSRQTMLYMNFLTPIFFILLVWLLQRYSAKILGFLLLTFYLLFFSYQCLEAGSFIYPIKTVRGKLYASNLTLARVMNAFFQTSLQLTPPGSPGFCYPYAMGFTYLSGISPIGKLSSVVPLIGEADQLPLLLEAIEQHQLPYIYYFPLGKDGLHASASVNQEMFWKLIEEDNRKILKNYSAFKVFGDVVAYKRNSSH